MPRLASESSHPTPFPAWMPLRHWRVLRTLHNPRYAGGMVSANGPVFEMPATPRPLLYPQ